MLRSLTSSRHFMKPRPRRKVSSESVVSLKLGNGTRQSSVLNCLRSVGGGQRVLQPLLMEPGYLAYEKKAKLIKVHAPKVLEFRKLVSDPETFEQIGKAIAILEPLRWAQQMADRDDGTISETMDYRRQAVEALSDLEKSHGIPLSEINSMTTELYANWDKFTSPDMFALAQLLDQRFGFEPIDYMSAADLDFSKQVKTALEGYMTLKQIEQPTRIKILTQLGELCTGKLFSDKLLIKSCEEMDPVTFWKLHGLSTAAHDLAIYVAIPILSMTDSAGPIERINSALKFIKSKRRIRLKDHRAFVITKIYVNSRALKRAERRLAQKVRRGYWPRAPRAPRAPLQLCDCEMGVLNALSSLTSSIPPVWCAAPARLAYA